MPENGASGPTRADELRALADDFLADPDIATYNLNTAKVAVLASRLGSEDAWNAFATMVKDVYDASGLSRPTWANVRAYLTNLKKAVVRVLRRAARLPDGVSHIENVEQMLESEAPLFVCIGLLLRHRRGRLWFDDFLCKIRSDWRGDGTSEVVPAFDVGDDTMRKIMVWMMARNVEILGHVNIRTVEQAVAYVAETDRRDVLVEHVKGVPLWDGSGRLGELMTKGFGIVTTPGADETEAERAARQEAADYVAAVGRNFLISLIARALKPGCKVDTMPIFMGPQGAFKSTAMQIIGGPFFREISESPTSKDFYLQLQGVWLGEVAELASIASTRVEINRVKAMLSRQVDNFRPPYGRESRDFPRRTVFAGTSNPSGSGALRDETGNRRFDPVLCGNIDLDWLTTHRDQLIAEALHEYENGATWWEVPQDAHAVAVGQYQQVSAHEETLRARLASSELYTGLEGCPPLARPDVTAGIDTPERWGNVVQVDRVCMQWLGMTASDASRMQHEMGAALTRLGWVRRRVSYRVNGEPRKLWCWVKNEVCTAEPVPVPEGRGTTNQTNIPF